MIAFGTQNKSGMGSAVKAHYTQWAIYGLVMGLMPGFRIDNAAHIGGLVGGFVIAWLAGEPKLFDNWRDKLWRGAATICVLLTAASFAIMVLFYTAMVR
jgi:rhomboid protease GluP